jgi:carboxyl-terminal processing protease
VPDLFELWLQQMWLILATDVNMTNRWRELGFAVLFSLASVSVCAHGVKAASNAKASSDDLSMQDRMRVASFVLSDIEQYFAHWQGVENPDFQRVYTVYLSAVSAAKDRRDFDMANLELFASLDNGHTGYVDKWLWKTYGQTTGLRVWYVNGQWLVEDSSRPSVAPGSVITQINGSPVDAFYSEQVKYISGSSDLAKRDHLFNIGFLFPKTFTVTLADGKTATIDRSAKTVQSANSQTSPQIPDDVVYGAIGSFVDPKEDARAVAFLQKHANAKSIIIDVRGNPGGSTPSKLIEALMTKPYRDWTSASAMSVGMLKMYGGIASTIDDKSDPEDHGYLQGLNDFFARPMMYWPGAVEQPKTPIYTGRLIVLVDRDCASACEDFVMPLKVTHRAVIIGERTFGSSGEPFERTISDDISYRVGARRMFFGDGSPFEGVGIDPDIAIELSPQDVRNNKDPVLDKAIAIARQDH